VDYRDNESGGRVMEMAIWIEGSSERCTMSGDLVECGDTTDDRSGRPAAVLSQNNLGRNTS
jgi:hypothetical protein